MKQGFHPVGRRTVARVVLAGLVGLALAGCGSDDANDDGSGGRHRVYSTCVLLMTALGPA